MLEPDEVAAAVPEGDKTLSISAFIPVGRIGTGVTGTVAGSLFTRLDRMRVPSNPFEVRLSAEDARHVRFVRPELVAEVEFRATVDGHLRHASFRGLREDKPASEIVRETPGHPPAAQPKSQQRTVKLTHPDRLYWPDKGVTKEGLADYYAEVWRFYRAVRSRTAAGVGAMPKRHRRREILPEARLERSYLQAD